MSDGKGVKESSYIYLEHHIQYTNNLKGSYRTFYFCTNVIQSIFEAYTIICVPK